MRDCKKKNSNLVIWRFFRFEPVWHMAVLKWWLVFVVDLTPFLPHHLLNLPIHQQHHSLDHPYPHMHNQTLYPFSLKYYNSSLISPSSSYSSTWILFPLHRNLQLGFFLSLITLWRFLGHHHRPSFLLCAGNCEMESKRTYKVEIEPSNTIRRRNKTLKLNLKQSSWRECWSGFFWTIFFFGFILWVCLFLLFSRVFMNMLFCLGFLLFLHTLRVR